MKKTAPTHLVVGSGEVGTAVFNVLAGHYSSVSKRDKVSDLVGRFDVMHVCLPSLKDFVGVAKKYIKEYKPRLVIVHSTVPVGTTKKIAPFAVHSPIRGVHPHLEKGIRTFVKYFGGAKAKQAAKIFSDMGIRTQVFRNSEATELGKILDTTYYGWNIIFAKEVARICGRLHLDFDEVYTIPNLEYNEGYRKLGRGNVARPVLKAMKGKIGGHCIIPNCELLDDWLTDTLKKRNRTY